jgi:hypothetical protein
VHVEGQTEETFVNEILKSHLQNFGYTSVSARLLGNARLKRNRGGIRSWPVAKSDIVGHLKYDSHCVSTTMVDFYGLPAEGQGGWPGRAGTGHLPCTQRALVLEQALFEDVASELGHTHNPHRFIPYVMLHEFEGLLFSHPLRFAHAIGRPDLAQGFQEIRDKFNTPEEINDSPLTAPSKRVEAKMPSYEKPLFGVIAALEIGLTSIRAECPHFASWIGRLETLIQPAAVQPH